MKFLIKFFLPFLMIGIMSPAFSATLKWSMPGDSLTLDPHAQNEGPTHMVSRQVYESLVTRTVDMSIQPQLATSWTTTDPETWVFQIRDGVVFSDGSPLISSDLVFSLNSDLCGASDVKELIDSITSVKSTFNNQVEIKTDGPNPILLNQLSQIFIMSEAWSKSNGCEQSQDYDASQETYCSINAMGTGPFVITLREQNTRTVFERNNSWWGDQSQHNLDKIELLPIKNDATRVAALLSGDIDFTNFTPAQDIKRINGSAMHKVESTPQARTIFFGMDQGIDELRSSNIKGKNPLKDKRVRLAMYHALDMDAIQDKVMRGLSEPAGMITFPGVQGYTKELDTRLAYDPNLSKKLLADAGYPDGFEITLDCPNNRYINDEAICVAAVGMFAKVGIKVNLDAQPKSIHFKDLQNGLSDFYMLGWGVPTFDSHYVYSFLLKSDGSWNKVGFKSDRVDELVSTMLTETNLEQRNANIAEAWAIVQDNMPYLPLHHQVISWATKSNVDVPIRTNNEPLFRFAKVN
jgi:peptide/nickel transport system substrate-binding protein